MYISIYIHIHTHTYTNTHTHTYNVLRKYKCVTLCWFYDNEKGSGQ